MCDMFHCTPPEARRLNLEEVKKIADYRTLEAAKAQHNQDVNKMDPAHVPLWMEAIEDLND